MKSSSWIRVGFMAIVVAWIFMVFLMRFGEAVDVIKFDRVHEDRDYVVKKLANGGEKIRVFGVTKPDLNVGVAIGRGYDFMEGNLREIGGDKGFRQPVFVVDGSKENAVPDWSVVKPDHIDLQHVVSCDTSKTTTAVSTSSSLQKEYSKSTTSDKSSGFSASVDLGGNGAGYGQQNANANSNSYRSLQKVVRSGKMTLVFEEATCSVYRAEINNFDLPKFDPAFKAAVQQLPTQVTVTSKQTFTDFVHTYGTHVVFRATLGSRYGKVYVLTKSAYEKIKEVEKDSADESSSSKGGFIKVKGVTLSASHSEADTGDKGQSEVKSNALAQSAENTFIYSVGALPKDNIQEWVEDSEHDPLPIGIHLKTMFEILYVHFGKEKALAYSQFLSTYQPPNGKAPVPHMKLGKCYLTQSTHFIMSDQKSQKSLIARCRRGDQVVSGTYEHLWNTHEDIKIAARALNMDQLKNDLVQYNKARFQELQIQHLLKEGSNLLHDFANAKSLKKVKEIFGDRLDPKFIGKWLSGKLMDLKITKKKALEGLANGLKTFDNTESTKPGMLKNMLKGNPVTKSIMNVGGSLLKSVNTRLGTFALDADEDADLESLNSALDDQKTVEEHADVLVNILNHLHSEYDFPAVVPPEDSTDTLIFKHIGDWMKQGLNHLNHAVKGLFPHAGRIDHALMSWANFHTFFQDVFKKFEHHLNVHTNRIHGSKLFKNTMNAIKKDGLENFEEPGNDILAVRNSLNWMFPYKNDRFVCGSANRGLKSTRRSSFGTCRAMCCSSDQFELVTVTSETQVHQKSLQLVVVTATCPRNYEVVSGGFMVKDYRVGRFVQIAGNSPKDEGKWECIARWTEEKYNPHTPLFKCYARCRKKPESGIPIMSTKSVPLEGGVAIASCDDNDVLMGGGWKAAGGIVYFKSTQMLDVDKTDGGKDFKCSLGSTSHSLRGTCYARCARLDTDGQEDEVTRNIRHCTYRLGDRFRSIGGKFKFSHALNLQTMVQSRNQKFHMKMEYRTYQPTLVQVNVYEEVGCRRFKKLGSIPLDVSKCLDQWKEARGLDTSKIKKTYWNYWRLRRMRNELRRQLGQFGMELKMKLDQNGFRFRTSKTQTDSEYCAYSGIVEGGLKKIELADNGDLNWYGDDGKILKSYRFSQCRDLYKQIGAKKNILKQGEVIGPGGGLVSDNRRYVLNFGRSSKLTLYKQNTRLSWRCHRPVVLYSQEQSHGRQLENLDEIAHRNYAHGKDKYGYSLRLMEDNNLVITNNDGNKIWSSDTAGVGFGKMELEVTNSGKVQLVDSVGEVHWTLRGGKIEKCELLRETLKIRSHQMSVGHKMNIVEGGLVSQNHEYVLRINEDSGTTKKNLEIWRDGDRYSDCNPERMCVLYRDVEELTVKSDGVYIKKQIGGVTNAFPFKDLIEISLNHAGHLTALTGKDHKSFRHQAITHGDCKAVTQGSILDQQWIHATTIDAKADRKRLIIDLNGKMPPASSYNQVMFVDRGSSNEWDYRHHTWESHGFNQKRMGIQVNGKWYRTGVIPHNWRENRYSYQWDQNMVLKFERSGKKCLQSHRQQPDCYKQIGFVLPPGHSGLTGLADLRSVSKRYYTYAVMNFQYDVFVRKV